MPQFPMSETRRRVLEKIPDYAVEITSIDDRIEVRIDDQVIASTDKALLIEETRHEPVYYLPRDDVRMDLFARTEHSTYCPFKGHASYWSMGDRENFVWSYEDPYPEVSGLKDYLSFYTNQVELTKF